MSLLTRGVDPERLEEELTGYQRAVSVLLYVVLFAHGFEAFLTNAGALKSLILPPRWALPSLRRCRYCGSVDIRVSWQQKSMSQ